MIGPLPRSSQGFQYLSVITDYFSKYVFCKPLREATAEAIKKHLEEVFLRFGAPKLLISDNGKQYTSSQIKSLCEKYGVDRRFTFAYSPQANPTERVNKNYRVLVLM